MSKEEQELHFWLATLEQHNSLGFVGPYNVWINKTFPFHEGVIRLAIGSGPCGAFRRIDPTLIGLDIWSKNYKKAGYRKFLSMVHYGGRMFPFKDNVFRYIYWLNAMDHTKPKYIPEIINEIDRVGTDDMILYFYSDIRHPDGMHYNLTEEMILEYFKRFNTSNLKTQRKALANSQDSVYGEIYR